MAGMLWEECSWQECCDRSVVSGVLRQECCGRSVHGKMALRLSSEIFISTTWIRFSFAP